MTSDFWSRVELTRPVRADPAAHARGLAASLVASGTEATLQYAEAFDRAMDALYTWPLWGAAYLAMGGCSDDTFEYLRAWIVGAGNQAWQRAITDPESLFVGLLESETDPDARWEELGLHEGEELLYAAGMAHERLTGEWLSARYQPSPDEPIGEEWDEDDLPDLFPDLTATLPEGWWEGGVLDAGAHGNDRLRVMVAVERGVASFSGGDHLEAARQLDPIVADPAEWELVAEDRRVDVAYVVGIGRLLAGNVDGASTALRLVETELEAADHVRRALAQVELARGDLGSAGRWIDQGRTAARADRVLAAKLSWRRGEREEAMRRASEELEIPTTPDDHPWDVAGSIQQAGRILADAGDVSGAERSVHVMVGLLGDAPPDLPLMVHLRLLEASVLRLHGRSDEALDLLGDLCPGLEGSDLAECLREQARARTALGREEEAVASYRIAIEEFERTGERWEARVAREESGL